ncbi:hypothetical protein [Streptomyces sp. NPDC056682]|uniref:hypothetical protein n=1 Tax=Streptomyces sp. NPDC056682 TaxID=3345909 RepID=UPI003694FAB2
MTKEFLDHGELDALFQKQGRSTATPTCWYELTSLPAHPSKTGGSRRSAEPRSRPTSRSRWKPTSASPYGSGQLEKRLSSQLGEGVWAESGLGAPVDIDLLQRRVALLEQDLADKRGALDERTEELEAARAANRELTRALNQGP